jgi:hypothetical protein
MLEVGIPIINGRGALGTAEWRKRPAKVNLLCARFRVAKTTN